MQDMSVSKCLAGCGCDCLVTLNVCVCICVCDNDCVHAFTHTWVPVRVCEEKRVGVQ